MYLISCYEGGVTKPITSRTKWIGRSLLLPALVVKMASSNAKEIKTMKLCKFSSILGKICGQPYTIVKKTVFPMAMYYFGHFILYPRTECVM